MSEIVSPGQIRRSEIALQTRVGWNIPNSQSFDAGLLDEHQLQEHKRRYPHAEFRTGLIPVFNCHGLTFAARRTSIWETPSVQHILADDHYEEVYRDNICPGDVILYVSSEDGDIEHSGIVVEVPRPPLFVPKIWSKWGFGAEVVHYANNCPYDFSQARYYRIRS